MERASKSLHSLGGSCVCVQCCHCRGEQLICSPDLRYAYQRFLVRILASCRDNPPRSFMVNRISLLSRPSVSPKAYFIFIATIPLLLPPSLPFYHRVPLSPSCLLPCSFSFSFSYFSLCLRFSDRPTSQPPPSFVLPFFPSVFLASPVSASPVTTGCVVVTVAAVNVRQSLSSSRLPLLSSSRRVASRSRARYVALLFIRFPLRVVKHKNFR